MRKKLQLLKNYIAKSRIVNLQIIKQLKKKNLKLSRSELETVIDLFSNNIVKALKEGKKVELRGFGTFFIKEIKEILTMLVGREAVSSLANSEELFPWDEYINIVNKVSEARYDDAFDEAEARFAQLENKLESGLTQKVYGVSLGINSVSYTHLTLPTKRIV